MCDLADVRVQVAQVGPQVTEAADPLGQNSQQPLVQLAARQHAAHALVLQGAAVSEQHNIEIIELIIRKNKYLIHLSL